MDAIIMVPSCLIVVNYRKKPQWFTPWIFKSTGILLVVIGDSWFQLFVVTSLTNELWPSSMIFAASRVIIAAGLLWSIINFVPQGTAANHSTNPSNNFDSSTRVTSSEFNKANRLRKAWSSNLLFVAMTGLCIFTVILIIGTALSSSSIWSLIQRPLFVDGPDINTKELGEASSPGDTVRFGALLPISGVFSSSGKSTETALRIALEDVNSNFSKSNSSLKAIKDFADKNGIILISPSSTAPTLAIEGDNVFRFVPNDLNQAKAISKIMWDQGIRVVVPFWRNDVYGSELMRAVRANFQAMGGVFDKDAEKLGYAPRTGILVASLHRINFIMWENALKALESRLKSAISQYGIDKVGVYVVSYDEVTPILIQAYSHPVLSKVKWYGSDKSALNEALVGHYESASFAANTSFCNPISSFGNNNTKNDNGNSYDNLLDKIRKEIHTEPSPYSAAAYDILRVAAIAENMTRHDNMNNMNNITDFQGIHDFRDAFIRAAKSYVGVTGNTTLNNMGDRAQGEYDFWKVKASKTGDTESFGWIKTNRCK